MGTGRDRGRGARRADRGLRRGRPARRGPRRRDRLARARRRRLRRHRRAGAEGAGRAASTPGDGRGLPRLGRAVRLGPQRRTHVRAGRRRHRPRHRVHHPTGGGRRHPGRRGALRGRPGPRRVPDGTSGRERGAGGARRGPGPGGDVDRAVARVGRWMAAVTEPAVAGRPSRTGDVADEELDVRLRERLRVLLCCLCLTLITTATRPGKMLADTKIDMPIDPTGLLSRALHMWDIEQFGRLQNQASGYLFPMGPFFALGHFAGIPGWITQRMWLSVLLCTAFLGVRTLAGRLGVGTPTGRLLGAMAYALGPHGLTSLGTNSSEYIPLAMLPWIVVPLATVTRRGGRPDGRGSGRLKAAALSGLAVACCGGITATAVLAVLVVPGLFVLTRMFGCVCFWFF